MAGSSAVDLEQQIDQWRRYISGRRAISAADVAEMEDHLRSRIDDLTAGGLDEDEAFLVAVKRMGNLDDVSREFAREHSERLWKQLVMVPDDSADAGSARFRDLAVLLGCAVGAGLAVKILTVAVDDAIVVLRNVAFVVLPFLAGYFAWRRRLSWPILLIPTAAAAVLAVVINGYPFRMPGSPGPGGSEGLDDPGMTQLLATVHAPVVLWLLFGVIYVGGDWRTHGRRMDLIRFTGELLVYLVLIALGGGLLTGLTAAVLGLVGIDIEPFFATWMLPFCVPDALLVAAWLVEAKKSVVENIAPVLARVFTPLAAVMLVAMFVALVTGDPLTTVDRTLLILMDAVLIVVLFLLLYSASARDPLEPAGMMDWLLLILVGAAIAVDAVALVAMLSRIAEFGFSANKTAALGLNLVLLVHLAWAGWLTFGLLQRRRTFAAVERWHTRYLLVYGLWSLIVVLVFPPVFGFV